MFTEVDVKAIALTLYGHHVAVTRLPGEHDYNFYLRTNEGKEFVMKISQSNEKQDIIDMQNDLLYRLKINATPFESPVLQNTLSGEWVGKWVGAEGEPFMVRLFTYISGTLLGEIQSKSDALLASLGQQLGHLSLALQSFMHPAAKRYIKWDLKHAQWIQTNVHHITQEQDKHCIDYFLARFEAHCVHVLSELRQSVIHGDINDYNVVVSRNAQGNEYVSGFIDYGDLVETATISELAIALTYAIMNKPDPLAAANHIVKAYHAVFPLEEPELAILFDLIGIRLCVSVVNSAIRKKEEPDNAYLVISEKPAWALLKQWIEIDPELAHDVFRQACQSTHQTEQWDKSDMLSKRKRLIGPNVGLSYETPLLIVRGKGQYLFDEKGRQYLDCVNNVSHVGHCHPKVVAAGQQQMALLNTNTRYLHELLPRYAERLTATLPQGLDVCFFVNSGSEANELALRLAQTYTNRHHFLVLDHGYHGNTSTLIDISPYKFNGPGGKGKPDFVRILPLPDSQAQTIQGLEQIDNHTAAFICESMPSCAGQIVLPDHYLQRIYSEVREAGGLCIADEVQVGLGRVGTHFWGFETQGVVPDIVTMGKPLGNGHPIGAVVTTRAIADSFCNGMEFFNTFGGNPVSCAIGLAVLEVIEEENLQKHALHTGNSLKQKLMELKTNHACIHDVRGSGLFLGIEFIIDGHSVSQTAEFTTRVINRMKDRGVLLSSDGPHHNVLKIKPPMVFCEKDNDTLVVNLDEVIKEQLLEET